MNALQFVIHRPVTVQVGVILVVLFGTLAAFSLPVQLTPDVAVPRITVTTIWPGAAPQEVEREILIKQEEKIKSVQGLLKMESSAGEGSATITLEFPVGTDIARRLFDVNEKVQQVTSYPQDVEKPTIVSGERQGANAIAWFILERLPDSSIPSIDLPYYRTLLVEKIQPLLSRSEGIASVGVYGGMDREVHIYIDPYKLAAREISPTQVRQVVRDSNIDVSAGNMDSGKFSSRVRTTGKFTSLMDISDLVLARRDGHPVYLRDVARVELGYKDPQTLVRSLGNEAIAVNATKQSGTNLIAVMDSLQGKVDQINREMLHPRGMHLAQVYDQTEYVYSAISLVLNNLWLGGGLSILILLLFLRELRSTLIIAVAIPVSVMGAFLGLQLMGRNFNVISLAGLAFAVGMVVDNSIVVLENIYRHRQLGKTPFEASYDGAREVWGAVVASTLTTLAVFLPVIFIKEEAGQLFRDIAIAISSAVFMSLIVSVLFIPMATARLWRKAPAQKPASQSRKSLLMSWGQSANHGISSMVDWLNRSFMRRIAVSVGITAGALLLASLLMPATAYLPSGNRNLVIGFLIPPPGYNNAEYEDLAAQIEDRLRPYWSLDEKGSLPPELQHPAWYQGKTPIPGIKSFFFVTFGNTIFMGARSPDPMNVKPVEDLLRYAASDLPGVISFAFQTSLFSRGLGAGNTIDLEITGNSIDEIKASAGALTGMIMQRFRTFPQPSPSNYNLGSPEFRVKLDLDRAGDLGLNVRDVGFLIRAMVDGAIISDYRDRGTTIDVKLMPVLEESEIAERLDQLPIYTPKQRMVPVSAFASVEEVSAPTQIRRLEEQRAIKLQVTPPAEMALSEEMVVLETEIIAPLRQSGALPPTVHTQLAGNADKLAAMRGAMSLNLLMALVITFLLLSALFESFFYPIVIMLSVPLAAVGGVVGLDIVHQFSGQQLDVLTMLGFVILIGTVVNNAILIVHQALQNIRNAGMDLDEAIADSVRTRIRPIFMSTMTSILGMLPLVLIPGPGSELYRGLGSVVIGGLFASTIFTLILVPTLFHLFYSLSTQVKSRLSP